MFKTAVLISVLSATLAGCMASDPQRAAVVVDPVGQTAAPDAGAVTGLLIE